MFCDVLYPDGTPFECDVRSILRKAVDSAKKEGLSFAFGNEMEFYLFKTDDDGLYLSSRGYFLSENFELEIDEKNLHLAGLSEDVCNFTTEHELMFSRQGVPIKFLKAVFKGPCL